MKIIRPAAVSAGVLSLTNIIESAPAAWSSLATYAAGDFVAIWSGTTAACYKSLSGGNTGNNPATATAWWAPWGSTYAEYDSGAVYAAGDRILDVGNHRIYESAVDANTGHALTDTAWWLDAGSSNRWAMFDAVNGTTTTHPSQIDVTLAPGGRVDAVALVGVNATTARVIVSTPTDGTVYDKTVSLVSTIGIGDWWSYLFEPVVRRTDYAFTDLPPYNDPTVRIIIDGAGGAVSCGTTIVGQQRYIGETEFGASVGINDYSKKTADDFGNYSLLERQFARLSNLTIWMDNSKTDEVHRLLAQYRATPIVYIGSESYSSTLIFGFYRSFNIEIRYATRSVCTLQVEGLN